MAEIQHKDISEADLHEPKGVSSALENTVYVSTGGGTGNWQKLKTPQISGVTTDGAVAGKKLITDGAEGYTLITDASYGTMGLTNNLATFALVAVADTTLATASQFVNLTGASAPWASENLYGVTFTTDRLTVPVTGIYRLSAVLKVSDFPSVIAKVAIRYKVSGATFGTRRALHDATGSNENGTLVLNELVSLTAADYVQIFIASDVTGNVVVNDAAVNIQLVRQTA